MNAMIVISIHIYSYSIYIYIYIHIVSIFLSLNFVSIPTTKLRDCVCYFPLWCNHFQLFDRQRLRLYNRNNEIWHFYFSRVSSPQNVVFPSTKKKKRVEYNIFRDELNRRKTPSSLSVIQRMFPFLRSPFVFASFAYPTSVHFTV